MKVLMYWFFWKFSQELFFRTTLKNNTFLWRLLLFRSIQPPINASKNPEFHTFTLETLKSYFYTGNKETYLINFVHYTVYKVCIYFRITLLCSISAYFCLEHGANMGRTPIDENLKYLQKVISFKCRFT